MGSLVHWLVVGTSTAFPVDELVRTALSTIGLGLAGAALTLVLALPVAWLSIRHRSRFATVAERSTYFSNALPGIVVALALVTVSLRVVPAIYQTIGMLLAAYAIMFLPRAMVSLRAAMAQAPPVLDDVAHALGAGPASRRSGGSPCRSSRRASAPGRRWCSSP